MVGTTGKLTIRLPSKTSVNAVSIDHILKNEALNIQSAPRMFRVFGRVNEEEWGNEVFLGQGSYSLDDGALYTQTFPFTAKSVPVQFITFEFLNNHGHSDFTCIYRVRVHGDNEEELAVPQTI